MASGSELRIALRALGVEAAPGALRIHYTFTNQAGEPIYVYNCVADARHQPLRHGAYTALRDSPKALHLGLRTPPIPSDWRVYSCVRPFAVRLLHRQSISGYVEVAKPVREWSPYFPADESPDSPLVTVTQVLLSTEYFRERDAIYVKK